ncbi:hypothetical protein QY97_03474 [Bacillus thermotolerans]|nr:hypothetical protein QY97_03474 [Bacillus thermotolerans]
MSAKTLSTFDCLAHFKRNDVRMVLRDMNKQAITNKKSSGRYKPLLVY